MATAAKETASPLRRQLAQILEFILPFAVVAGVWQLLASSGLFPPVLIPSLSRVIQTAWNLILSGVLFEHLFASAARLLIGFTIGCVVGIVLGLAMGLSIRTERFFLPLLNLTLPIPSIALLPLTVLWFGLGNVSVVILVAFVVSLQVTLNTWTGVKTTSGLLLRVGQSMGAPRTMVIARIVLPSALPFVLTGLRLGLARGWIGTVAGEMVSSSNWGLGWMIFNALQFLQTANMLVGLATIGLVGYAVEKLILQPIETRTVVRWGMLHR
jgi:ABC-type nitrate/sulfonate/bicarbonate transport system permease component